MKHPILHGLVAAAAVAVGACGSTPATLPVASHTPAIPGVFSEHTPIELVKDGFAGTEGPLGLRDGSLVFTETPANRITRIAPDGAISKFLDNSNGSNGLALAPNGDVYAVQVAQTRVGIVHPPERARVLAERYEGLPFGRPNDLVLATDGTVYFTDSGPNLAAAQAPASPVAKPAVYRISPQGLLQRIAADIERPNGIQLSPDQTVLYVADTRGEHLLAYDLGVDGQVGAKRQFARLAGFRQTENGPSSGADGLAVDALGRVYVATTVGVQVFGPAGEALGTVPLPKAPQNLAFAGRDKRSLYVVGRGAVYRIAALTPGFQGRAK